MIRAGVAARLALLVALSPPLAGCATLHALLIPGPVKAGQRVRVTEADSNPPVRTAKLVALTDDSVILGPDSLAVPAGAGAVTRRLALPVGAVSEFEVSRGVHRDVLAGALIGTVVGSVVGLVALCTRVHDCLGHGSADAPVGPSLGLFGASVAGGLLIGGTVGAFVRSEHWEEIPLDQEHAGRDARPLHTPRLQFGVALFPSFLGAGGTVGLRERAHR